MRWRCPLGLWIRMTEAERDAYLAAHPGTYIDACDLTTNDGASANDNDTYQRDRAEYLEDVRATEADAKDWLT